MTRRYSVEAYDPNNEPSRIRRKRSFDTEEMASAFAQYLVTTYGYNVTTTDKEPTK